jgi:hypothetical protein
MALGVRKIVGLEGFFRLVSFCFLTVCLEVIFKIKCATKNSETLINFENEDLSMCRILREIQSTVKSILYLSYS